MRMSGELERTEKAIGIIDLGSNSVRLLLVRVHADGSTTILNQVKHMVRLGEGGFTHNRLQEETMARTIAVLRGLAEMCAVYETTEIIAIATAAVRDAVNGPEFIRRVQEKTGIDFTVVSGREEARLIYLGVSSGLEHSKSLRLFIDIGGGSTELIVGDSQSYVNLDSLKLGCVRLTNLFFEDNKGPVSAYTYAALQRYVRNEALHSFQRIAGFEIPEAVASSGTAQNLAEIAAALEQQDAARTGKPSMASKHVLSYDGLRRAVKELCSRTLEERKSVPGINPNRADVIIAGAAILQTIMEEQGFESVTISNRNLQTASSSTTSCGRIRRRPVPASPPARKASSSWHGSAASRKNIPGTSRSWPLNCSTARGPSGCTTPRPYRASCCTMPPCCTTSGSSFPLRTTTRTATI